MGLFDPPVCSEVKLLLQQQRLTEAARRLLREPEPRHRSVRVCWRKFPAGWPSRLGITPIRAYSAPQSNHLLLPNAAANWIRTACNSKVSFNSPLENAMRSRTLNGPGWVKRNDSRD